MSNKLTEKPIGSKASYVFGMEDGILKRFVAGIIPITYEEISAGILTLADGRYKVTTLKDGVITIVAEREGVVSPWSFGTILLSPATITANNGATATLSDALLHTVFFTSYTGDWSAATSFTLGDDPTVYNIASYTDTLTRTTPLFVDVVGGVLCKDCLVTLNGKNVPAMYDLESDKVIVELKYKASLSQVGTDNPIAQVFENSANFLGWESFGGPGNYKLNLGETYLKSQIYIPGMGDWNGIGTGCGVLFDGDDVGKYSMYPGVIGGGDTFDHITLEVYDKTGSSEELSNLISDTKLYLPAISIYLINP
jgi:hypothetical protein